MNIIYQDIIAIKIVLLVLSISRKSSVKLVMRKREVHSTMTSEQILAKDRKRRAAMTNEQREAKLTKKSATRAAIANEYYYQTNF